MELSIVHSRALSGLSAPPVRVETHLSNGLPAFNIVGLPETAVRESKERVRSALLNSHFAFPDRRITVNLAPADLPKEGGRFDLPIALGILLASGQLDDKQSSPHEFLGELALDGSLRAVPGAVCAALAASACGNTLVVPAPNESNACQVPDARILAAPDLLTLCAHINGSTTLRAATAVAEPNPPSYHDLADVIGQAAARRALEIAASGGHNLLFVGPPGTGKTLLASRLPGILPPPSREESLVALALRDFQGRNTANEALKRPFRNPHHSATAAALTTTNIPQETAVDPPSQTAKDAASAPTPKQNRKKVPVNISPKSRIAPNASQRIQNSISIFSSLRENTYCSVVLVIVYICMCIRVFMCVHLGSLQGELLPFDKHVCVCSYVFVCVYVLVVYVQLSESILFCISVHLLLSNLGRFIIK